MRRTWNAALKVLAVGGLLAVAAPAAQAGNFGAGFGHVGHRCTPYCGHHNSNYGRWNGGFVGWNGGFNNGLGGLGKGFGLGGFNGNYGRWNGGFNNGFDGGQRGGSPNNGHSRGR